MSVSLLGEKQELEKIEGEIVSGMMEGETLQLALSQYAALHPCLHSVL